MKKFFAGLFVFIILVVYPATLLVTVIRYAVLQPTVVKRIVHASQIGEELPTLLAEQNTDDPEQAQVMHAVSTSLKPTDVYDVTDQVVDTVAIWLGTNKPIEQLDLRIDTGTLKTKLQATAGEGADLSFIPDQLTSQDALSQLSKSEIVNPAELREWNTNLDKLRSTVRNIFMLMWIGWGVIAFGLLMILLLRHKPGYVLFGWYGWTLLLMTLECVPLLIVLWLAPGWILPWINGNTTATVLEVINNALSELMHHLIVPFSIVMGGTLLSSIGLLILKNVLKHHKASPAQ